MDSIIRDIIEAEHVQAGKSLAQIARDYQLLYREIRSVMDKFKIPINRIYRKHEGSYGLPKTKWCIIKRNAKKRGIALNIDIDYAGMLLEKQGYKCELSGLKIQSLSSSGKIIRDTNASLDRIDPSRSYEECNVWWIHKDINSMKSQFSVIEFLMMCYLVINPIKDIPKINHEPQLPKDILSDLKANAKKRNLKIEVSNEYLIELFKKQRGTCAITGLRLSLEERERCGAVMGKRLRTASIDRIDSLKHYTESNVFWTHKDVNQSRKHFSMKYFTKMCGLVVNHSIGK